MTTIAQKFGTDTPAIYKHDPVSVVNSPIKSQVAVGIEVEVENAVQNASIRGTCWQVKGDGSLRNNGAEFVTHPITAAYAPIALDQLMTTLLTPKCHFSPRTSTHVHLNAQDLHTHQVVDFVLVYTVFEKLFYKFAGRGRIRNIYCVPLHETNLVHALVDVNMSAEWSKYTGLNLVTLRSFGTLEFRQMHGTFNVEKLTKWISLITHLYEYIKASDTKTIRALLTSMDDDFNFPQLINTIWGGDGEYLKYNDINDVKVPYGVVKSALVGAKVTAQLRSAYVASSPFFSFKA